MMNGTPTIHPLGISAPILQLPWTERITLALHLSYTPLGEYQPLQLIPLPPPREAKERFANKYQYTAMLMGYAIGLGNIWRFPYKVGRNGGGAFLLVYFLALIFVAAPLFFLELILGQRFVSGAVGAFRRIRRSWSGLGYASILTCFVLSTYYNYLVGITVFYLYHSFVGIVSGRLPWTQCHTSAEAFYNDAVGLTIYDDPEVDKGERSKLIGSLVASCAVVLVAVFFTLCKGLQAAGRVAYVTVIVPFGIILIVLGRCAALPGAATGISYFLTPDFAVYWKDVQPAYVAPACFAATYGCKIANMSTTPTFVDTLTPINAVAVSADASLSAIHGLGRMLAAWGTACGQILFSLSPGLGTAIALSSYNPPSTDIWRVGAIVSASNSIFSVLCGLTVFSVVGFLSSQCDVAPSVVASEGPKLAFVTFATGLASFDNGGRSSAFMSILFFLMLFFLGLDSAFATVETLVTFTMDLAARRGIVLQRWIVSASVCFIMFLLCLPFCTPSGTQLVEVLDHFCGTYTLLTVCILEAVVVSWVYGTRKIMQDFDSLRTGHRLSSFYPFAWKWIVPGVLIFLFAMLFIEDVSTSTFTTGWLTFGLFTFIAPVAVIPIMALYYRAKSPSMSSRYEGHRYDFPNRAQLGEPMLDTETGLEYQEMAEHEHMTDPVEGPSDSGPAVAGSSSAGTVPSS